MLKLLRNIVSMTLVFALLLSSFSGLAKAQEIKEEDKQVEKMAEQIKFIFEEATIKDKYGKVVDINIDMIENKYGKSEDLEVLKQEIEKLKPMYDDPFKQETPAVDRCIERKIRANFAEVLSVAFLGSIISNIVNKEYELAARKMIRLGVKSSVLAIAGQLAYYLGTCIWEEEGW